MKNETVKILDASYHRNGAGGVGCFIVRFDYKGTGTPKETLMATFYPDARGYTQVFDPLDIVSAKFRSADYFWPLLIAEEKTIDILCFGSI